MLRVLLFGLCLPVLALGDTPSLLTVRDADGKSKPVATAADWAKRRAQILANMQEVMGPLPADAKKVPLDPKVIEESDRGAYVRQKVTIAVEEGDRLPLYILVPKKRTGKVSAVVCLHPTSRGLGKGIPTGFGDKPDRHYAVHLAERGYVTLAPDYVNSGDYRIDPYRAGYASATMKGI
jgi:acetyl esterase/lipase